MALDIIAQDLIIDETAGLQDDDTLATNATVTYLLGLDGAGGLNPPQVAYQANFVTATASAGETISSIVLAQNASGTAFSTTVGVNSELQTVDGNYIWLFKDTTNANVVIGVIGTSDPAAMPTVPGTLAFSLALVSTSATTADLYTVQYVPLLHPDDTNPDDRIDLTDHVYASASGVTTVSFTGANAAPGNPDFYVINSGTDATKQLLVTGFVGGANGSANVSTQGFGVANQSINPGETLQVDFVTGGTLASGTASQIQYGSHLETITQAGFTINQITPSQPAKRVDITIRAFNVTVDEQGLNFWNGSPTTNVPIVSVRLTGTSGFANLITADGTYATGSGNVTVSGLGTNAVTITGLDNVTVVDITASGNMDRLTVTGVDANEGCDITEFHFTSQTPNARVEEVGSYINFDDDGPTITRNATAIPTLTTDDTDIPDSAGPVSFAGLFTGSFGTDGAKDADNDGTADDDASSYTLSLKNGDGTDSTLVDTLSGDAILLRVNSDGDVEGYLENATSTLAFLIDLAGNGDITLTQYRAIYHDNPLDHEETGGEAETMPADLIVLTATRIDDDLDSASATANIGDAFRFEDDGPSVTGASVETTVDDDGGTGGNDGGAGDDDGPRVTTGSVAALFDGGADGLESYAISIANLADDPDPPVLYSQGGLVEFAQDGNLVTGYVDTDSSGDYDALLDRDVFTFELDELTGDFTFTLIDQLDHPVSGTEDNLDIDIGILLQAVDGDGDVSDEAAPIQLTIVADDDSPVIESQISDGLVDGDMVDDSVTNSLNGAVGFDENDANDESGAGVKTYTFTSFTTPTNAWPNLVGVLSDDKTTISYYDGVGGDLIYSIVLDQDGSGQYTFTVHKQETSQKLEFDFADLPSGQNLFGVLVDRENGVLQVDGRGLLVVGRDAVLNANGGYTNTGDTINTSKGGGGVTIGVDNQMFDPGDGAVFVFLNNPDDKAIGGLNPGGLTQNTADDADTLGFAATSSTRSAELEVVQKQGGAATGMRITAYDVDVPGPDNTIVSANNPLGADVNAEGRAFIDNPLNGGTIVSINSVQVFDRANPTVLLLNVTINADGTFASYSAASGYGLTTTLAPNGAVTVTVTGFDGNDSIVYTTVGDHDAVLTEGTSGKWDLGGINLTESIDFPDQLFDFSVAINDYDGDSDGGTGTTFANFSVGVDGTGAADDGIVADVDPLPTPIAPLGLSFEAAMFESARVFADADLALATLHGQQYA